MKNKLGLFFVLVVALVSLVSIVSAMTYSILPIKYPDVLPPATPSVKEMSVFVKGDLVWYGLCYQMPGSNPNTNPWLCSGTQYSLPSIERGENVPVKVVFTAGTSHQEVAVKTWINGYREDIEDETSVFDMFAGYSYSKNLNLEIPTDIDARETYTLYVEVHNSVQFTGVYKAQIELQTQKTSNLLEIKNIEFYAGRDICSCSTEQRIKGVCGECSTVFEAGSSLYADVLVKNMGSQVQEDVFVKMSIPELCLERTIYVGDLGANMYNRASSADSRLATLYLVLPENMKGTYDVKIEAFNDDVSVVATQKITVEAKTSEVQVVLEQTRADVEQGKSAIYSIYVANSGSEDETFTVSVEGTQGWANSQVSPAVFTLANGQSKLVNLQLNVGSEAIAAEHQFTVKVAYGNEVKSYSFSANVTEPQGSSLKFWLLIVGIVLAVAIIVLLIVLLGKNGVKSGAEKPAEEYSYY